MKKVVLLVIDGWGEGAKGTSNAIKLAKPTTMQMLFKNYPSTLLNASGTDVGLLPGYIGNSEVGHLHLGAGRLVEQDLTRIHSEIKNGKFYKNKVLLQAMKNAKRSTLHLLGLVSDGGVHSHIDHLFALLELANRQGVGKVYVHIITDGRDVPPRSSLKYVARVERKIQSYNKGWQIASVMGRYYAMDRDNRWTREQGAYDVLVRDKGHSSQTAKQAVQEAYSRGETDEFISPTNIMKHGSHNVCDGDVIIFFNFRSDRARQITRAFVDPQFSWFRRKRIQKLHFVCLTQYDAGIKSPVAYPPVHLKNTLGEVISKKGLNQFRLAETEKWAHVTYFFNGLCECVFENEERLLIPSPKVKTYDLKPQMSLKKIVKKAVSVVKNSSHDFMLINFANADMVGHTGNKEATIEAVKAVDLAVARLVRVCLANDWTLCITADHGNAEQLLLSDGSPCTAHTTNSVPFIIVSSDKKVALTKKKYSLYHVAPTILQLLGLKKPRQMVNGMLK
jgi:2,3-bisphosphoglycerate-independent phosphoglycerate mutase